MEGAWPSSPAAVTRPVEPDGETQDAGAGRRWSGQLLIGHDGKLLRRSVAAGKGQWAHRGQASGAALLGELGCRGVGGRVSLRCFSLRSFIKKKLLNLSFTNWFRSCCIDCLRMTA